MFSWYTYELYVLITIYFLFQYIPYFKIFIMKVNLRLFRSLFFLLTLIRKFYIFSPKSILSKSDKLDNKVKRIGPQMENFQVFRRRKKFAITKNIVRMVIVMQALVRGWLQRKRFQRIMIKVKHILNIIMCLKSLLFFQFYWDITDIQHCTSLTYTA